jgi:hypothetical protein
MPFTRPRSLRRTANAALLALATAAASCAAPRGAAPLYPPAGDARLPADTTLFAAVVHFLEDDPSGAPLRVDPRPLRPDPRLVTLHDLTVVPELVDTVAQVRPFAEVDEAVVARRSELIERLGRLQTDAVVDARCPGVLLPTGTAVVERRRRHCPTEGSYRSAALALPRPGAPYWPGNVDERPRYEGVDVVSVRVIVRHLSAAGSVERSMDYVFAYTSEHDVRYLKRTDLLIVE